MCNAPCKLWFSLTCRCEKFNLLSSLDHNNFVLFYYICFVCTAILHITVCVTFLLSLFLPPALPPSQQLTQYDADTAHLHPPSSPYSAPTSPDLKPGSPDTPGSDGPPLPHVPPSPTSSQTSSRSSQVGSPKKDRGSPEPPTPTPRQPATPQQPAPPTPSTMPTSPQPTPQQPTPLPPQQPPPQARVELFPGETDMIRTQSPAGSDRGQRSYPSSQSDQDSRHSRQSSANSGMLFDVCLTVNHKKWLRCKFLGVGRTYVN